MSPKDYIRRAYEELTGKKPGRGGRKKYANDFKINQPMFLVGGIAMLCLIIFIGLLWALLPYGKNDPADCVFKIPEENGPQSLMNTCVTLEKSLTPSTRRLGLSNRPSLPRERGMLFDFKETGQYCMWMKDMNFSIDMIWLSPDKEIVAIREGVSPKTFPASFCGPGTERYVIEVNAGIVQEAGLQKGHKLKF